jgi:hypothetical protein
LISLVQPGHFVCPEIIQEATRNDRALLLVHPARPEAPMQFMLQRPVGVLILLVLLGQRSVDSQSSRHQSGVTSGKGNFADADGFRIAGRQIRTRRAIFEIRHGTF